MKEATIDFDDFADSFDLAEDADVSSWPALEVVVTYETHPAEPDVGIFGTQVELVDTQCYIDGILCADVSAFGVAVYERICGDIEGDELAVHAAIKAKIDALEEDLAEDD